VLLGHRISSTKLHLFDIKISKNSNIVKCNKTKQYYYLKELFSILMYFKMPFTPVMGNFQHPLLQLEYNLVFLYIF